MAGFSTNQLLLEFTVQSGCTDVMPANLQAFEFSDDEDNEDIIPALADPLNTVVIVSGNGKPYVAGSLPGILEKIKIPCAAQVSGYENCEADHPVVAPSGSKPLQTLQAGDVLSIYDMSVMVTSVGGGTGGFSGKGLAVLPFMQGTLVSVEFDGVQAWTAQEPGVTGGCVYEVGGYFRTKALSAQELARQQSELVAALVNPTDPAGFHGTLKDALIRYDAGVTVADLSQFTTAVLQGSQTVAAALAEVTDEYSDPRLISIRNELDSLMQVLKTNDSLMKATGELVRIDNLTGVYTSLFERLEQLKNEGKPDENNPVYAISNVAVSSIDDKSARISWQSQGPVSKYVIEYYDTDGGVRQETVTGTSLNLSRLRTGMDYKYRILAYNDDKLVASYGEDGFRTVKPTIAKPENLAYTVLGGNSIKITWDKNVQHKDFKIVFRGENGEEGYLYPTTNEIKVNNLTPDVKYTYELVAYGEGKVESEAATDQFNVGTVCQIFASGPRRIIAGTELTLTATGCYGYVGAKKDQVANGTVTWSTADGGIIGKGHTIKLSPDITTTYIATCYLGSGSGCKDDVTVTVDKKCEGVVASATPNSISLGGAVLLRSSGCRGSVEWLEGKVTDGKIVGREANLSVYPKEINSYSYTLACNDGDGQWCFSNTEPVEVVSSCENFVVAASTTGSYSRWNRSVRVTAVGCDGDVTWDIKEKRWKEVSYPDKNSINISMYGRGFTVNAECKTTGCTATTGYIDRPTSYTSCSGRIELIAETSSTITLRVDNVSYGNWAWSDGDTRNPRTFPKPNHSQVYTVKINAGKSGCVGSYAYEVKKGQESIELPCIDFRISVPREVVVFREGGTKNIVLTAQSCSNGVDAGKVIWSKNGKSLGEGKGSNYSLTIPITKADIGSVKISGTCSLGDQLVSETMLVRLETEEEEKCRKAQNRFFAWVEPPVHKEGAFFEPVYGKRAKVYVNGCKGTIRWESLKMKSGAIETGVQTSQSESEVWFSVPVMETSYYKVTCIPGCGPDKTQWVTVKVRQTEEDQQQYPPVITSPQDVKNYSEPNKDCKYPESKLTVELGSFIEKNYESNRGGYNHVFEVTKDGAPYALALSASYCYNGTEVQKPRGEPRWFKDASRTQLYENYNNGVTIISTVPTTNTTYYGRCYYKKSEYCDFEMTVKIPSTNNRESGETIPDLAAVEEGPAIERACVYPVANAVNALLENVICQKLALVEGSNHQKLEIVRNELISQGLNLGAITDEMLKLVAEGKCSEAVKLLTKDITGNEKVDKLDELVGKNNIDHLFNTAIVQLADDEIINSDFVNRRIETFDSPIPDPNARVTSVGICPDYYFTPSGKRIRIEGIGNCVVSVNGILMSFERDGKKYVPLYKRSTLAFVGYHVEADFYNKATQSIDATVKVAPLAELNSWIKDMEYPEESSNIARFIAFIEQNKTKAGVIGNYSVENFNAVKALLAQLPDAVYKIVEGDGTVFYFDLLKVKKLLEATLADTDAQLAMLNSILTNPETVCPGASEQICKVYNCVYNNIKGYQSMHVLNGRLPLETRKKLLTLLAQNSLTSGTIPGGCAFASNGEATVLSLLQTTPENEQKAILEFLNAPTSEGTLLKVFVSRIDGTNFINITSLVSQWVLKAYPVPRPFDLKTAIGKNRYLHFNDNFFGSFNTESILQDGKVSLSTRKLFTGSNTSYSITAGPYEYVLVTFQNDFGVGDAKFAKGGSYILPAIYVYLLFNEDTKQAYKTTAEVTAMTALTALGVSEVAAAVESGSTLGFVAGVIDIGIGVGDIVINTAFRNEIRDIYPNLADNFDKIAMCYGLGRVAGVGLEAIFRKTYIDSYLAQYDLRLSGEAKATAKKLHDQLQNPENFAEFTDDVAGLVTELNRLKSDNWVEGRKLSAEAVNMHTTPEMTFPPYKSATFVSDIKVQPGEVLYCVEFESQASPGAWMGKKLFNTEEEARQYFAIIPEFKDLNNQMVLREYKVKESIKARLGLAGPQWSPSINKTFVGGGEQYQLLDGANWTTNWTKNFEHQGYIDGAETIRNYVKKLN